MNEVEGVIDIRDRPTAKRTDDVLNDRRFIMIEKWAGARVLYFNQPLEEVLVGFCFQLLITST